MTKIILLAIFLAFQVLAVNSKSLLISPTEELLLEGSGDGGPRQLGSFEPFIEERSRKLAASQREMSDSDLTAESSDLSIQGKDQQVDGRNLQHHPMQYRVAIPQSLLRQPSQLHHNGAAKQTTTGYYDAIGGGSTINNGYQPAYATGSSHDGQYLPSSNYHYRPHDYNLVSGQTMDSQTQSTQYSYSRPIESHLPILNEVYELESPEVKVFTTKWSRKNGNPYKTVVSFKSAKTAIAPIEYDRLFQPEFYVQEEVKPHMIPKHKHRHEHEPKFHSKESIKEILDKKTEEKSHKSSETHLIYPSTPIPTSTTAGPKIIVKFEEKIPLKTKLFLVSHPPKTSTITSTTTSTTTTTTTTTTTSTTKAPKKKDKIFAAHKKDDLKAITKVGTAIENSLKPPVEVFVKKVGQTDKHDNILDDVLTAALSEAEILAGKIEKTGKKLLGKKDSTSSKGIGVKADAKMAVNADPKLDQKVSNEPKTSGNSMSHREADMMANTSIDLAGLSPLGSNLNLNPSITPDLQNLELEALQQLLQDLLKGNMPFGARQMQSISR